MQTETKVFRPVMKALDERGAFTAVFSTLNVIDHHGDVTRPGAYRRGQEVLVGAYQHEMSALPVGRGVIHSDDREAWIEGKFFLDTPHGDATYRTVRNAGALLQWSYVFVVEDSEPGTFEGKHVRFLKGIDVWSVDPVLRGAGLHTRTTVVKDHAVRVDLQHEFVKFQASRARELGIVN